jgi:L-fuculose-phosphate aldolase
MPSRQEILSACIDVCHRLYDRGFVMGTDGNVSARLDNGNILTTRTGMNKGLAGDKDFVEVNADGGRVVGKELPSSELGMHLYIYRSRPDVRAVVHAHPVHATAFATARIPLDRPVFPEVVVGIGRIPLAEYATPSTEEVASSLAPYVKTCEAILLANHGVVTFGDDLYSAYFKLEKVEQAAHIISVARTLGGETTLTVAELERLHKVTLKNYGRNPQAKK